MSARGETLDAIGLSINLHQWSLCCMSRLATETHDREDKGSKSNRRGIRENNFVKRCLLTYLILYFNFLS